MIYKRLWDALAKGECDYSAVLEKQGASFDDTLSDHFIAQMHAVLEDAGYDKNIRLTDLRQVCEMVRESFTSAGVLEKSLDIVYRSRFSPVKSQKSSISKSMDDSPSKKGKAVVINIDSDSSDERGQADKEFPVSPSDITAAMSAPILEAAVEGPKGASEDGPRSASSARKSLTASKSAPNVLQHESPKKSHSAYRSNKSNSVLEKGDIIGVETFNHNDTFLSAWLSRMASFWRSERDPIGVELADVGVKCRSCEYADG